MKVQWPSQAQRIRYVVFRYSHHSPHSGYSRLSEYGVSDNQGETILVSKPLSRHIIRERMLWRLARGTPGYDRASMAAELQLGWRLLRERGCIYHLLYGETTYRYSGFLNNINQNKIVATFHLPPGGIREAVQVDWHIRKLSGVVCVGRNQQEFFSKLLDPSRVFFVPLGIDTEFYTPPTSFETRDPDLCLLVGENYRDFPTFRGVVELVTYRRPSTKFVAVIPKVTYELVGKHPNLTLLSGVSEAEFLNLYRSAALMIMPLHDATANNAVLESLACGLPMVVSDVGAIRDYTTAECSVLIPQHDARGMAEAIVDLLNDPSERRRMSELSRNHALQFSWHRVVQQLQSVYAGLN
jgi:glycosyltransferase involved in cell wall biosynthesis